MIRTNTGIKIEQSFLITLLICLLNSKVATAQEATAQDIGSAVIRGVVLTETGVPVPKARVDISTAAPKEGPALFCPSCYSDCQKWTTTNAEGNFELGDLDTSLKFRLVISAAGYRTHQTGLLAPDLEPRELQLAERPKNQDPSRIVKGVVKDEEGLPISGALISPYFVINRQGLRSSSTTGLLPVVSDADGYFEMDLSDGIEGLDVILSANGFCDRKGDDFKPRTQIREFELLEGVRIVGRVESTGQPVPGIRVAVAPKYGLVRGEAFPQGPRPAVTDSDGRFELLNIAPGMQYCVYSVVGDGNRSLSKAVIETQRFIAPISGETIDLGELEIVAPVSLGGRLVRSDGEPVGEMFLRLNRESARDLIKVPVARDGAFRIDGLPPEVYEIELASENVELDPDRIKTLLWSKTSLRRLLAESDTDFQLPIRSVSENIPRQNLAGTQEISGQVVYGDVGGLEGIRVAVAYPESDSVLRRARGEEATNTDADGQFKFSGLPNARVWLRLYRPSADGMVFVFLGMVQPELNSNDLRIEIGREATHQYEIIAGGDTPFVPVHPRHR